MKPISACKKALILTLTVCILVLVLGVLPVHGESELYDNVLRLHVLASFPVKERFIHFLLHFVAVLKNSLKFDGSSYWN